jgi:flagellar FliJ protein
MSAKTVLVTLQELASKAVDKAAEELGISHQALSDEKKTLQMLEKYRDEYLDKLTDRLESGVDMQLHQNYQRFLRMLDEAIKGQAQVVEHAKTKVAMDQQLWQESNKKKFSYEVLGDRYQKKEDLLEVRRDQKLMDEFAMRSSKVRIA